MLIQLSLQAIMPLPINKRNRTYWTRDTQTNPINNDTFTQRSRQPTLDNIKYCPTAKSNFRLSGLHCSVQPADVISKAVLCADLIYTDRLAKMQQLLAIDIGDTGGSASGKTSVSRAIFNTFSGTSLLLLAQDAYYKLRHKPFSERLHINYDHPLDLHTPLLKTTLEQLLTHSAVHQPV